MSHFVGIGLVLGFLLPHTSTMLLMVNPILCFFYQCFKSNRAWYRNNMIVVIAIFVSLLINIPQGVQSKAIFSSFVILLYFFTFPMVGKLKIHNTYFYIILSVILISQLAYALNISFVVNLMNTYYPFSEEFQNAFEYMQENIGRDNVLDFRMGGIYRNSNQCARHITFLLSTFLIINHDYSYRKLMPFILLSLFGVILSGSRTGFAVASAILIVFLFVDKRVPSVWRWILLLVAIVILFTGSDVFRGLNVLSGFNDSANAKMDTFYYYITNESSVGRLLLGYLDVSRFNAQTVAVMTNFDSDYGSLIFSYGFIGFICILVYFFTIFSKMDKFGRIFFVLLLWMFSATIVKSYRSFFVFMLLLSYVYNQHRIIRNN